LTKGGIFGWGWSKIKRLRELEMVQY